MFLVFLLVLVILMVTFRFTEGFQVSEAEKRAPLLISNYNEIGKVLKNYSLMTDNFIV